MNLSSLARLCVLFSCGITLLTCTTRHPDQRQIPDAATPMIVGKPSYLSSPFVTAGDRVYMVGHQDGSFPDNIKWYRETQ